MGLDSIITRFDFTKATVVLLCESFVVTLEFFERSIRNAEKVDLVLLE